MSTILPLFGKLSSAKSTERLDATAELVASATALHHQFSVPEIGTNSIPDVELEQCIAPDVLYTLRRLTRGLASSRESSRLGFAVALTEVCSPNPCQKAANFFFVAATLQTQHGHSWPNPRSYPRRVRWRRIIVRPRGA
jgi:DNA polymerase phi